MVARTIALPNIKKCFIPDPGYIICDTDLRQADAQVVAWEADDDELKTIFREGIDLHNANAEVLGVPRQDAKAGVHLTNYGGSANTLARTIGCTIHAAENFQSRWFGHHPGIKDWHDRVADSLASHRGVQNIFGYQIKYFDRIEGLLPEALAWIPQSTVAIIISKAMIEIEQYDPTIQCLAQVHDSMVIQYRKMHEQDAQRAIHRAMTVTCPYPDPLIIGSDLDTSPHSWGDCKRVVWPDDNDRIDLSHLKTPPQLRSQIWV